MAQVKKATWLGKLPGFAGEAGLYRLSTPLEGHKFVIVSAANVYGTGSETYIFGATEDGEIASWSELEGSQRGTLEHEVALAGAGYSIGGAE